LPSAEGNLNRNFPKAGEQGSARGLLAGELWALAQQFKPDWLIDLHEGFDFNRINPASVGSTIIVHPAPPANAAAARMLEAVNATITDDQKKFRARGPPINGSLARAAAEQLGARAMILETTTKSQPLSQRARQHRLMVHALLTHLGLLDGSVQVDQITDPRRKSSFAAPCNGWPRQTGLPPGKRNPRARNKPRTQ
jgi:predicted deacylase